MEPIAQNSAMPKPSGLMNERERAICGRVGEARGILKWSQPSLAAELGITQNQLAGIEYGRVPLRYRVGDQICDLADLNQRWLATGEPTRYRYFKVFPESAAIIDGNALFSFAYDRHLRADIEGFWRVATKRLGRPPEDGDFEASDWLLEGCVIGEPKGRVIERDLVRFLMMEFRRLPFDLQTKLVGNIAAELESFRKSHRAEIEKHLQDCQHIPALADSIFSSNQPSYRKAGLDIESEPDKSSPVKHRKSMLERSVEVLCRLTSKRGAKAALAREMGVTRQAVDQWLSGKTAPSADLMLRLLEWAVKEQAKQKRPRSVSTTAKANVRTETNHKGT